MRIAMVGTRGVPARYGGFETAVEEIGARLVARGHEVIVYCRSDDRSPEHLGMRRIVLPAVRHKVLETLSHTGLSVAHLIVHRPDLVLLFNAANAVYLPALRAARIPTAVHVDGLEWRRGKWGPAGRRYYLAAERMAVRWADALIADAHGIAEHYLRSYGAATTFIPYGAPILAHPQWQKLDGLGVTRGGFHLVVARLEPENHVDLIVSGYVASQARLPLLVVGSVPYASDYGEFVERCAAADPRVRMLGGVWDQDLLDALYAGSASYLHGHSVGGTNPSLLRALGAGAPVTAFDVNFNREVAADTAIYFTTPRDVARRIEQVEADPGAAGARGAAGRDGVALRYRWDEVAERYEALCRRLLGGRAMRQRQGTVAR